MQPIIKPSAHAGDELPEEQPPPAQAGADGEKPTGWTAAWQAVDRSVTAFDTSCIGQAAISAVIVLILAISVVSNLPAAAITRSASSVVRPVALLTGLDQSWSVFAPTPPQRLDYIEVHVVMASGENKTWTLPRRNRLMGVAVSHRWRKFKEYLVTNEAIRADFVHWVVRELTAPGDRPVRVDMLLRTQRLLPLGVEGAGQTAVQNLYSENLTGTR